MGATIVNSREAWFHSGSPPAGVAWYWFDIQVAGRLDARIEPRLRVRPVESAEVFIDGVSIGGKGRGHTSLLAWNTSGIWPLPRESFDDGRVSIAVRVETSRWLHPLRPDGISSIKVGDAHSISLWNAVSINVDKYIGDAVMALFHNADDAVRAAVRCQRDLERSNSGRATPIAVGIGLHTGPLVLGAVGTHDRLSCTVIGDTVNLASRIESLTGRYGAGIVCSSETYRGLSGLAAFELRLIDRVVTKGKSEVTEIFEVLDGLSPAVREQRIAPRETLKMALESFAGGQLDDAVLLLEGIAQPSDAIPALYLERCAELRANGLPTGWDGVVHLASKAG